MMEISGRGFEDGIVRRRATFLFAVAMPWITVRYNLYPIGYANTALGVRRPQGRNQPLPVVRNLFEREGGLPFVDPTRSLVLGHSEGGLVASRVAAMNPSVTHSAALAGGGPTRLFNMTELARSGLVYREFGELPEQREAKLLLDWASVMQDPDGPNKDFLGHPYRAWTSFAASSCMEELLRTQARVYIAQGTDDHNVRPITFEILRAHLLAHGRDVTADWVVGADHGFFFPADGKRDGSIRTVCPNQQMVFGGSEGLL
jgi:dienelactone hydrolase